MEKRYIKGNIVMLAIILAFDIWYMFGGGLFAKGMASMMFVAAGVVNFMYCIENKADIKFPKWMVIALICAMFADIAINLNFYLGVVIFATAHIFYFISYCKLNKINRRDLFCGAGIFAFALLVIEVAPFLNFGSSLMKSVCSIYALIISLMVGKAVSNLLEEKNATNTAIVIGSILFFVSDMMLMFDKFGSVPGTSYLCLGTYYPAQFILAFSLFKHATVNSVVKYKKNTKLAKAS